MRSRFLTSETNLREGISFKFLIMATLLYSRQECQILKNTWTVLLIMQWKSTDITPTQMKTKMKCGSNCIYMSHSVR